MGDDYFATSKRGELQEFQEELQHPKENRRKDAVKKVIAAMTVGKDVSGLFTDVLNCIQTNNLELKKLVYLYVLNHAKLHPDRAILAVNTFQKDSGDPNPLIRALAIRTMGCIRVDKVTEYLMDPLRAALKDKDPYVRKTAALGVAKLFDISPQLVEEGGFYEELQGLLSDSNPTVVANAVAALSEIDELSPTNVFQVTKANVQKLQSALNECTEWGQVFILNALAKYVPDSAADATRICDRVVPRLNHANSAVVLGAVKVIMVYLPHITDQEKETALAKKMAAPLVTLLTTKEPEIQYVALRNINLICQKRRQILASELRVFIIKYNDPIYVKMEKLEILIMLANERNVEQVLHEFQEAASEVDVEFVRKAVRAIGRCAIKIDQAAGRCIQVLLELIRTKVNYVVQEAVIVIRDIFRRYPGKYEKIIANLCENLETLDEPEAKAAMIWIIGEYAPRIENASDMLESFLDNFADEAPQVQLQLLTAIVKLFLNKPKETQDMVQNVLNLATQESDSPDLRDRGFVYWRLLTADPEAAKQVVLSDRPLISDSSINLDTVLLDSLIAQLSTLSAVYHKPPQAFVTKLKGTTSLKKEQAPKSAAAAAPAAAPAPVAAAPVANLLDLDIDDTPSGTAGGSSGGGGLLDDLGMGAPAPAAGGGGGGGLADLDDIFGGGASASTPAASAVVKTEVLAASAAAGMGISAAFARSAGGTKLHLTFSNTTAAPISGIMLQFNKNLFGLGPAQPNSSVAPGGTTDAVVDCVFAETQLGDVSMGDNVQIAVKNNVGVYYFQMRCPVNAVLVEESEGKLAPDAFQAAWRANASENTANVSSSASAEDIQARMASRNIHFIASTQVDGKPGLYFSAKTSGGQQILVELVVGGGVRSCVKSPAGWENIVQSVVQEALR